MEEGLEEETPAQLCTRGLTAGLQSVWLTSGDVHLQPQLPFKSS